MLHYNLATPYTTPTPYKTHPRPPKTPQALHEAEVVYVWEVHEAEVVWEVGTTYEVQVEEPPYTTHPRPPKTKRYMKRR